MGCYQEIYLAFRKNPEVFVEEYIRQLGMYLIKPTDISGFNQLGLPGAPMAAPVGIPRTNIRILFFYVGNHFFCTLMYVLIFLHITKWGLWTTYIKIIYIYR